MKKITKIIAVICTMALIAASAAACSLEYESRFTEKESKDTAGEETVKESEETTAEETTHAAPTETADPYAGLTGTSKWVRTPVTVYSGEDSPKIATFLKKGEEVEILGHGRLTSSGGLDMIQIRSGDVMGWVYAKYLADSIEEAEAVYQSIYDIHKDRSYTYDLYGGSPESLDWYPVEKEEFAANKLMQDARCMYLCMDAINSIDDYLELAGENGVNSIVLDIKDYRLICPFDIAAEMAPTANSLSYTSKEDVDSAVRKIKDAGMYLILRIVTFNDPLYAEDHPDECIDSPESSQLWPSAYNRNVWYYNVALAEEAIDKFHPNEIQFDYVRFPEETFAMSDAGNADFKNEYDEEKAEAVQNFLFYACDRIHSHNVYVSADVFAECANEYVTAYGQYYPAVSNVVDVISAMPYPDHFERNIDTWTDPYDLLLTWSRKAAERQTEIETPALSRTWLCGYSVPFWSPSVTCDSEYIFREASAIYSGGLRDGFLLWNGGSNYQTYAAIGYAWGYDYSSEFPVIIPQEPETEVYVEPEYDEPEYNEPEYYEEENGEDEYYEGGYEEPGYEEGYDEGYEEGYDEGYDEGGEEYEYGPDDEGYEE